MRRPEAARERVGAADWPALAAALDEHGYATLPLLGAEECRALRALYDDDDAFRRRIVMQRHAYGSGEYKYFRYPLPELVEGLRCAIYPHLAPVAERWRERLREPSRFPPTLGWLSRRMPSRGPAAADAADAEIRPRRLQPAAPGSLWRAGLPIAVDGAAQRSADRFFSGGEFLLVEQRPRVQSRGEVVPLRQGEAVIFPVHHRPVEGSRGSFRVTMRHGVSRVRSRRALHPRHHLP